MNEDIRKSINKRIEELLKLVDQSVRNGCKNGLKYREASKVSKEFSNAGMLIMTDLLRLTPESSRRGRKHD